MLGFHGGDHGQARVQLQEGAVVLVGFGKGRGPGTASGVSVPPFDPAADQGHRVQPTRLGDSRGHRRHGGLPVRPGDHEGLPRVEHLVAEAPSLEEARTDAGPALVQAVQRALAKDPDERFQSAHDVMLQLEWVRDAGSQAEAVVVDRQHQRVPPLRASCSSSTARGACACVVRSDFAAPGDVAVQVDGPLIRVDDVTIALGKCYMTFYANKMREVVALPDGFKKRYMLSAFKVTIVSDR